MDALAGFLLVVLIFALIVIWVVRLGKWTSRQVDKERGESHPPSDGPES
jgi:hypothetical protein